MPNPVIDIGSNLEENIVRWARALRFGGHKLDVFNVIYSGKRSRWTPYEISQRARHLSTKRITEVGKRLHNDTLVRQRDGWPVLYEKIPEVHHYKNRILAAAKNHQRREAIPTKRRTQVSVINRAQRAVSTRFITIDEIDQFSRVRNLKRPKAKAPIAEKDFKAALQKIFEDEGEHPDWGGETNDFFTNKLRIKGKRFPAAFALKGPGVRVRVMTPGKWGKHGNQIQRLVGSPAHVLFLQFEGQIDEWSLDQLKKLAQNKANQERTNIYYGLIDGPDSLRLRAAYPRAFHSC